MEVAFIGFWQNSLLAIKYYNIYYDIFWIDFGKMAETSPQRSGR